MGMRQSEQCFVVLKEIFHHSFYFEHFPDVLSVWPAIYSIEESEACLQKGIADAAKERTFVFTCTNVTRNLSFHAALHDCLQGATEDSNG